MLKETSATIELETKLVEIYRTRDEANRVVGIRVATADGYKTIEAKKGVIMATGGFSSNVEMRETPGSVPDRGSADHQQSRPRPPAKASTLRRRSARIPPR